MISRISGQVIEKNSNYIVVNTGGFSYDVFIPSTVMQRLDESIAGDGKISLITYHYHQNDQAKSIPVLIGFLSDAEKDFFEVFITVSGIGPRAALKALNQPISLIAKAIDEGDVKFLRSLPGIGEQRAREIIAKLQNKVGRFGLIRDAAARKDEGARDKGITEEAMSVLMQLQYKRQEAADMVKKAMSVSEGIQTTEELLNIVYKQRKAD